MDLLGGIADAIGGIAGDMTGGGGGDFLSELLGAFGGGGGGSSGGTGSEIGKIASEALPLVAMFL